MKMLLTVILGLMVSFANAEFVNRLEGSVNLPTTCREYTCPKPTHNSGTNANLYREVLTMKRNWSNNVSYTFNHMEQVGGRQQFYRQFSGSQTSCEKYPDGAFSCTPQPVNGCSFHVRLGFRTRRGNSRVAVYVANVPPRIYNGGSAVQIYHIGTVLTNTTIRFQLECTGGNACLEDSVTVISLKYTCA